MSLTLTRPARRAPSSIGSTGAELIMSRQASLLCCLIVWLQLLMLHCGYISCFLLLSVSMTATGGDYVCRAVNVSDLYLYFLERITSPCT